MRLTELNAKFLKWIDDPHFRWGNPEVSFAEADGVDFLCPLCFLVNGGPVGTHSVICWKPNVPQTTHPIPGRWNFQGTDLRDLTLIAGSSSIFLTGPGCQWHGYIQNGEIVGGLAAEDVARAAKYYNDWELTRRRMKMPKESWKSDDAPEADSESPRVPLSVGDPLRAIQDYASRYGLTIVSEQCLRNLKASCPNEVTSQDIEDGFKRWKANGWITKG